MTDQINPNGISALEFLLRGQQAGAPQLAPGQPQPPVDLRALIAPPAPQQPSAFELLKRQQLEGAGAPQVEQQSLIQRALGSLFGN